jgi:hypothetical protein
MLTLTLRPLWPRGRSPRYLLDLRLGETRGWVKPKAGLDDIEELKFLTLPGLELRPLGRPARRQ